MHVKRQLRQEAGFGCCVCGLPIIQYHHIVPQSQDQHNRPDDMMVLCPNHHDAVTKGAVPEEEQRAQKAAPLNIQRGLAQGVLKMNQSYCAVTFGSCQMVGDAVAIIIDGEPLLSLGVEDGRLTISAALYGQSREVLATINENEWTAGQPGAWDLEADWQRLTVRQKAGELTLRLDARTEPLRLRAILRKNHEIVDIRPSGIFIGNQEISMHDLCFVGMGLQISTSPAGVKWIEDPNLRQSAIISDPDPLSRLAKAVQALARQRTS